MFKHKSVMKWLRAIIFLVAVLLGSYSPAVRADALDHWTGSELLTNLPYNGPYAYVWSVAYGNGQFVAVGEYPQGDAGFVDTSSDGTHWVTRVNIPNPSLLNLFSIIFAAGKFTAVGYGGYGNQDIYQTTNGIDWVLVTNSICTNLRDVTYGGGRYVAVGDNEAWSTFGLTNMNISISSDGTTWTPEKSVSNSSNAHNLTSIAYGAGVFVAVDDSGYYYRSVTGTTWTQTYNGIGSTVSFCNNLFIASYGPGTNFVSADGSNWALVTNNTGGFFGKVIYANGYYIAVTSSNICTSTDGTNWARRAQSPVNYALYNGPQLKEATAYGNGVVVSICNLFGQQSGFAYASDPVVAIGIKPGNGATLNLSGLNGRTNRIDYSTNLLTGTGWQTLTNVVLTNSPQTWTDTAPGTPRYYRAVLLP